MSKRLISDQPTSAKCAHKASGFCLARNPIQSTSTGSSRFVTLSDNLGKRGTLRAQSRLLHRSVESSSPSKNQLNTEFPVLGSQDAADHEEVHPNTSDNEVTEHTQDKKKRKRYKTCVSDIFIFLHI